MHSLIPELFERIVTGLPEAVKSPIALIAYVAGVISVVVLAMRVQRHKELLSKIETFPSNQRADLVRSEMGALIPPSVTASDWLRSRIHMYLFVSFMAVLGVIVLLAVLAWNSPVKGEAASEHHAATPTAISVGHGASAISATTINGGVHVQNK
jgi:hypothetical protein